MSNNLMIQPSAMMRRFCLLLNKAVLCISICLVAWLFLLFKYIYYSFQPKHYGVYLQKACSHSRRLWWILLGIAASKWPNLKVGILIHNNSKDIWENRRLLNKPSGARENQDVLSENSAGTFIGLLQPRHGERCIDRTTGTAQSSLV